MFLQLCDQWSHLKTREVAEKVSAPLLYHDFYNRRYRYATTSS